MRLVPIDMLEDGMELAREIPAAAPGGLPLLREGVRLSPKFARALDQHNIRSVWVTDDMGEGITPEHLLSGRMRHAVEKAARDCYMAAAEAVEHQSTLPRAALLQIELAAADLADALGRHEAHALTFDDLAPAAAYTHTHAVRTCALGLLVAQSVFTGDGWEDTAGARHQNSLKDRYEQLAIGLLVLDIGKHAVPLDVIEKQGELSDREWRQIKAHVQAGLDLLAGSQIGLLARTVVADHHERFDGTGYPNGRAGHEIHELARIAAVADTYDAVTSDRPHRAARAPHTGVAVVRDGAGTLFDPHIVEHFQKVAMPYPVGYTIALPDRRPGAITHVNPSDPERPTVRYRQTSGSLTESVMHIHDGVVLSGYELADDVDVDAAQHSRACALAA